MPVSTRGTIAPNPKPNADTDFSISALTNLFSGGPARGIINRVMRELGPMNPAAPAFPLAAEALAPLRARAEAGGLGDFSPLWSGQNPTRCMEIPAARLTQELASCLVK
jgi:nitronate monooxygenase